MDQAQKPSVARIVHYVAFGTPGGEFKAGACRAAVITQVNVLHSVGSGPANQIGPDGTLLNVGLCVLNPNGMYFNENVKYDEGKAPGTWHWPERT